MVPTGSNDLCSLAEGAGMAYKNQEENHSFSQRKNSSRKRDYLNYANIILMGTIPVPDRHLSRLVMG